MDRRRLARLEYQDIYTQAAEAARATGFTADDLMDEMRRFLALSPEKQREEMRHWKGDLTSADVVELEALVRRYRRILAAVRPPRPRIT